MKTLENQIAEFEQAINDNTFESDFHKAPEFIKLMADVKHQLRWLKERNIATDSLTLKEVTHLYKEMRPIYQEAYKATEVQKRQELINQAISHFGGTPQTPPAMVNTTNAAPPPITEVCIDEIYPLFMAEKRKTQEWADRAQDEQERAFKLFSELLNNKKINLITKQDMRLVKNALLNMPANRNKMPQYRNKSLKEILAKENKDTIGVVTINQYITKINALFEWCVVHGYCHENPASGLKMTETKKNTTQRESFTDEDLNNIFKLPIHLKNISKEPAKFWAPLIALYSGARVNEICQLYLDDIRQIDDIWYFRFDDTHEDQRIKTECGQRVVPVHSQLIEFGFLKYIKYCEKHKKKRVFEELTLHKDGYGKSISRWFGNYKKKAGIAANNIKVFHSFRHNYIDNLKQQQVNIQLIKSLAGHSSDDITMDTYGKKYSISILRDAAEKVTYPNVDLSHIKWPI